MNLREHSGTKGVVEKLLICILIIIGISVCMVSTMSGKQGEERARTLDDGWYYLEGDQKVELELPQKLETGEETLVLYNDSLTADVAGLRISIKAAEYKAVIACGERVIYQYDDKAFPRNAQMRSKLHCDGYLPAFYNGEMLSITLFNQENTSYQVPQVYIGTGNAILLNEIKESIFLLGVAVIMFALSIFAIGAGLYLKKNRVDDVRFLNVAAFLIVCSVWCVTDSGFVQQYCGNYALNSTVSFFAFMVLAIPMIHFIKNTERLKKYKVLDVLMILFYANAVVQGALRYLGVFEFIEMLWTTHVLLLVGCVCITVLILKEVKENPTEELKTILYAFILLEASGIFALVLYWSLEIPYYSFIFEIGIIVYVILLLKGVLLSAAQNMRAKTEMEVLRRLAKEDRLTGLGNRRAFDDYIASLQLEAAMLENALLIFMDIDCLKVTNDSYGHSAGDELIIATSRCLKNVFEHMGRCFRISGDEFCVIIENPKKRVEEMYRMLDNEILRYNRNNRLWLSVAKGGSYLRDEDGNIKTISNWKYQADCEMYEDKKRKRHE